MPRYTPSKWNKKHVKNSHNCYAYFLNKINLSQAKKCNSKLKRNITSKTKKYFTTKKGKKHECYPCMRPQPGGIMDLKISKKHYNCKNISERVLRDNPNIKKSTRIQKCPKGSHKGLLMTVPMYRTPKEWFHFARQDNDKSWSHKDGTQKVRKFRLSSYKKKKICNYFCVPHHKKLKMKAVPEFLDCNY